MARRKNTKHQALNRFCLLVSGLALGWLVGLSASPVIQTILASLIAVVVSITGALAGLSSSDADKESGSSSEATENAPKPSNVQKRLPALLDPMPVMLMVVGLACGASIGIYARTNDWLGARTNSLVEEWKDTGLSSKEITTRVFDSLYPPPTPVKSETQDTANPTPASNPNTNTNQSISPVNTTSPTRERDRSEATSKSTRPIPQPPVKNEVRRGILFTASLEECQRLRNAEDYEELRREMVSTKDNNLVSLAKTCKTLECLQAGVNKACAKYK